MKPHALAATLSLFLGGAVQAAAIDLDPIQSNHVQGSAALLRPSAGSSRVQRQMPASMSELPEPEVFVMMLVGLILIGYKASRIDSGEKFTPGADER